MIYFLQATDGGPVKIGFTENLVRRRMQLESRYKTPLNVLKTMDGGREDEFQLHQRFAHLRLGHTEQFRPALELMEFIGQALLVSADPDAAEVMQPQTGFTMRVTDEWRGWLERLGDHLRTPTSTIVDHALVKYAKDMGFKEEAPKR